MLLLAGVGLIVWSLFFKDRVNDDSWLSGNKDESLQKQENNSDEVAGQKYLEGVLFRSESPVRGNFKLVSGEGDIYIKTSRDFNGLVGYQVIVVINGTKDNFELLDIRSKIEDSGYLLQY